MEELQQITMDEYLGLKKEIKTHITTIVKSFVRIGETLCKIDQARAYGLDGYKSVAEMAKAEYGMTPGGVSRFMGVYRKYCINGQLKDGYENYSYAQLVEMMQLPEEDAGLIRPETQRESIRELKRFNRDGENDIHQLENWKNPTPEEEENRQILKDLLETMFKLGSQRDAFDRICAAVREDVSAEKFAGLVNPGGNRTVRSGRAMAFFYENEVKIKIWSRPAPVKLTYGDIVEAVREKFSGVLHEEKDWWAAVYAPEKEEEKREPTEKPEQHTAGTGKAEKRNMDSGTDRKTAEPAGKKKEQPPIAPAQKSEEKTEENAIDTEPEYMLEDDEEKCEGCRFRHPDGKAKEIAYHAVCEDCYGGKSYKPYIPPKEQQETREEGSSRQQEEDQIPGQDNVMNHPELLPEGIQPTTATINGHEQEATVEPTPAQRVEECLSLLSCIQGNLALQNYPPALKQAQKLVEHLEALI